MGYDALVTSEDDLFADRYRLDKILGSGGSGSVWAARDVVLDRPVAVKLLARGKTDEVSLARLQTEARLAGSLHHQGIAQIYDYGRATGRPGHDEPTPYIVMQLVDGPSLTTVLSERGPLGVAEVLDLVARVADALAVAHGAGIIHRDLKPGNIVLDDQGNPVLVDFGIASSVGRDPLTLTGTIVGTVDYLSPEQGGGQSASPQSDLYALGMVAYEALTGSRPLARETAVATALAHIQDPVPALPAHVPQAAAALVLQMLAKQREDRPTSAREVATRAATLRALVQQPEAPTGALTTVIGTPREPHRRSVLAAAAVLGLVLLVAAAVAGRADGQVIPDVTGLRASQALTALDEVGLREVEKIYSDDVPSESRGTVLAQEPAAGQPADGGVVVLTLASGRVRVAENDFVGATYERATRELSALGLEPRADSAATPADAVVMAVNPTGRVGIGSVVRLSVAATAEPAASGTTSGQRSTARSGGPSKAAKSQPSRTSPSKSKGKAKGKSKGQGKKKGKK